MSASIKWNQATLFQRTQKLFKSLGDIASDPYLKRDLAEFTKTMLYKRIKSGKGVTSDSSRFANTSARQLKPLSKTYKRYRRTGFVTFKAKKWYKSIYEVVDVEFYVGKPALGEFGRPDKSNLTMTGQLLQSMRFEVKKFGYMVYIPATSRRGSTLTNAKLAQYLSRGGRPFMNLTSGEYRIVQSRMKSQIQKRLKKLLK